MIHKIIAKTSDFRIWLQQDDIERTEIQVCVDVFTTINETNKWVAVSHFYVDPEILVSFIVTLMEEMESNNETE